MNKYIEADHSAERKEGTMDTRLSTRQMNRLNNVRKKFGELNTLCGTDGFFIYTSSTGVSLSWPEEPKALIPLLRRFQAASTRKPTKSSAERSNEPIDLGHLLFSISGHERLDNLSVPQLECLLEHIDGIEAKFSPSDIHTREEKEQDDHHTSTGQKGTTRDQKEQDHIDAGEKEHIKVLDLLGNFYGDENYSEVKQIREKGDHFAASEVLGKTREDGGSRFVCPALDLSLHL